MSVFSLKANKRQRKVCVTNFFVYLIFLILNHLIYILSFYTKNTDNDKRTEEMEVYRMGDKIADNVSLNNEINTKKKKWLLTWKKK